MATAATPLVMCRPCLIDWQNEMAVAESRPRVELSQRARGACERMTSAMETRLRLRVSSSKGVSGVSGCQQCQIKKAHHVLSTRDAADVVVADLRADVRTR